MVIESTVTRDYIHNEPGSNIPFGMAGFYTPLEETRLEYKGREVLYITGTVTMEAPCCKMKPDWVYVMVPGYITQPNYRESEAGEKVSQVEPVKDKAERAELTRMITGKEGNIPVDFW
ncbi:MAG: hypothetical protein JW712_04040 [Dehalococcoidales bacterium]|nr:hypothetical protein [Dehalococcoidales bacterium]